MNNFWHGFFQVALTAGQIFLSIQYPALANQLNPIISGVTNNLHTVEMTKAQNPPTVLMTSNPVNSVASTVAKN